MAFSYDLSSPNDDILLISRLRLHIGDHQIAQHDLGNGVLPGGQHFTDEELLDISSREEKHFYRSVSAIYEHLSGTWARFSMSELGPYKEDARKVSDNYRQMADDLRRQHGYVPTLPDPNKRSVFSNPSKVYRGGE